jgi:peptidoglycan L-alanyl-D-glutamate endopeptidase CwlK
VLFNVRKEIGMILDKEKLHPRLIKLAEELKIACERKGFPIKFTQGYRSKVEQDALYAQGRIKPGKTVTNARGGYSMHNWGIAIDFCRNDGMGPYEDYDGFFTAVGAIGKKLGLEWGGDWKSFKDKPHFQLPDWGSGTATLRSRYGTYEEFKKTWPDSGADTAKKKTSADKAEDIKMKTIKRGSKGKAVKIWQIVIGATPDGKFGTLTETATKALQKKHKLTVDGVVGNKTWKAGLESV